MIDCKPDIKMTKNKDLNYKVICGDCRSSVPNLIEDFASGDIICRDCGSVLMDRLIDTRSEWRTFNNENSGGGDDPSRVGAAVDPLLMDIEGELTLDATVIGKMDSGAGISKELRNAHHKSVFRSSDKNLLEGFKMISVMCERIGLPKLIADRAKQFYKKSEEEKLYKGKGGVEAVIAACIYIACRVEKVPRTFREMSSLTMVTKKEIGKYYKLLLPILFPSGTEFLLSASSGAGMTINSSFGSSGAPLESGGGKPSSPLSNTSGENERRKSPKPQLSASPFATVNVVDFMSRFCSHLALPNDIKKHALALCQRASGLENIAGKSPTSIAAACIYMVSQLFPQYKKSQQHIAYVTGVSEMTIKSTYKDMLPYKYQLITMDMAPKAFIEALPSS